MSSSQVTCAFCATLNPSSASACLACGAPIELPKLQPVRITEVPDSAVPSMLETSHQDVPAEPLGSQVKEGLAAVGTGLGLAGIGGLLFRTLAEALAILTASLVIGFSAGRLSPAGGAFIFLLLAVGGSALVGFAVGSVIKMSIFVLFSAPFGALLGIGAALVLKLNSPGTPWLPLLAIAGACLLALLGGRSNRIARFAGYQRFRPLLGAVGGIMFGLIGFAIGSLIR